MSEPWRQAHLGTVATLQRGYDLPHRERKLGSVPVVTSSGFGDTHSEARVRGPGVVTGRYGTIGQVFVVEEDFWPLNTTLYVKDFHGNDPFFIAHLLRTIDFHSHSGKSGVPGVNRNDLHELIVGLPPLPEQRAIAAALSDVDALLTKLDQFIAKKCDVKQAAMQQLLTGQTRLPGLQVNPGYKQTEAGVIPEDWDAGYIGDKTTKIGSGITPSGGEKVYRREGRPFLRSQNVGWGQLLLDDIAFIDEATHDNFKATEIEAGDVFLNITGASIGRSSVADIHVENGNVNQHVCIIRTIKNQLDPYFLNYFLLSKAGQRQIDSFQAGGNRQGLNFGQIRSFHLPIPPLLEQTTIATVLSDMDTELAALETRRDKTRALKQGMMQELLTGRIRLV